LDQLSRLAARLVPSAIAEVFHVALGDFIFPSMMSYQLPHESAVLVHMVPRFT